MHPRLAEGLRLLGVDPESAVDAGPAAQDVERRLGMKLPASALDLLRFPDLMPAVARAIEGTAILPQAWPVSDGTYMADVHEPVLWLLWENQGVVVWGLPLRRGDDPPILVGYSKEDRMPTIAYATTVAEFIY